MAPTIAIVGAGFMGSAHAANYASLSERVLLIQRTTATRSFSQSM